MMVCQQNVAPLEKFVRLHHFFYLISYTCTAGVHWFLNIFLSQLIHASFLFILVKVCKIKVKVGWGQILLSDLLSVDNVVQVNFIVSLIQSYPHFMIWHYNVYMLHILMWNTPPGNKLHPAMHLAEHCFWGEIKKNVLCGHSPNNNFPTLWLIQT